MLFTSGRQKSRGKVRSEVEKVTWHGSLHSQGKQARYSCLMEIPAAFRVQLAFFCHPLEALTDSNHFPGFCNHIPCVVRKDSLLGFPKKVLVSISDRPDSKNNQRWVIKSVLLKRQVILFFYWMFVFIYSDFRAETCQVLQQKHSHTFSQIFFLSFYKDYFPHFIEKDVAAQWNSHWFFQGHSKCKVRNLTQATLLSHVFSCSRSSTVDWIYHRGWVVQSRELRN